MSEHTPGPWAVREGDGNYLWEVVGKSPRGKDVVICRPAGKDRAANARLIAAAPDMLEALNAAQYYIGQLEAAQRGTPVRDLDEAQSAFIAANTKARTALNHD